MIMNMSIQPEQRTEQSLLTDAMIGENVHRLMWPHRDKTQQRLGELLGIDQGSISKRLRGKTKWAATEIVLAANWLGVDPCELLVPPAGFEPAAFCSEDPTECPADNLPAQLTNVFALRGTHGGQTVGDHRDQINVRQLFRERN